MKTNSTLAVLVTIIIIFVGGYFLLKKPKWAPPVIPAVVTTHYSCSSRSIEAIYGDSSVALTLSDGRKLSLTQVLSGSGVRYESGTVVFVSKGDNAFLQENGITTYTNCLANASKGGSVSGTLNFTDQGKTFTFSYPDTLVASGGDIGYTQSWRTNTQTLGIILAKVVIPKSTQPQTNFSEATFSIGTSSDAKAIKECLTPTNGEQSGGVVTINGLAYNKITLSDAGAGNFYDTTSYRVLHNSQCYAIEYTIHSTNIGNYSPDQGIKEFDKQKVVTALEGMVHSFQFLGMK